MAGYWTDEELERARARIDADRASRGQPPEIVAPLPYEVLTSLVVRRIVDERAAAKRAARLGRES